MQAILSLIVLIVFGAAAGIGVGKVFGGLSLGRIGDAALGAFGGVVGAWLASHVPGLDGLIGDLMADVGGAGGVDLAALAGQALVGVVGGGLQTVFIGFLKSRFVKS